MNSKDHWSTLRRVYTGPVMVVTLILLIIFISPYAIKTGYWSVINRMQTQTVENIESILTDIYKKAGDNNISSEKIKEILPEKTSLINHSRCLNSECRKLNTYLLLFGGDKGFFGFLIVMLLVAYNLLRGIITMFVIPMREQEERSGYSPQFKTQVNGYNIETGMRAVFLYISHKKVRDKIKKRWNLKKAFNQWNIDWGYEVFYKLHRVVEFLKYISIIAFLFNAWQWLSQPIYIPLL